MKLSIMAALGYSALGIGIVFAMLIALMIVLYIFGVVSKNAKKKPMHAAQAVTVPDTGDDPAVFAAIAAAISAFQNGRLFVIKNIKTAPIPDKWVSEGRHEAFARRGSQKK